MSRTAKARRKFPAIPPSRSKDPTVEKMREVLSIGLGDVGNELDQFVTRRDVQEGYRVQGTRIIRSGGGGGSLPTTTVSALSNLVAMGAFRFINLAWEGINQEHYSYTEIWRSADDNLSNAVLVGTTRASMYPDPVGSGETWYYWVRAISTSGDPGPYNDTSGTMGQSALDPDYIIDQLQGQLTESELAAELLTPIQAIPGIQQTVGDHSAAISILQQDVSDNYAAIELKASTSVVNDLAGEVTDIQAQFTLKLDVNGYVSGIGLMNDGATSQFIVASDAVYFVDPGQSVTEFNPNTNYSSMDALRNTQFVFGYAEVEGEKRFAINIPAYIPEAYITNLMVQSVSADKIFAASGTLAEAFIGNGEITNAMITNVIQSNNYTADVSGWIIQKSGYAEFNNIRARGHIEADSGYISSSLQIGGTSRDLAELVQMAEDAGDTSIFQDWIRPGTTLINGNKIYTGDAYVDTLQIKGQAVTFPVGARSAARIEVPWNPADASQFNSIRALSFTLQQGGPGIVFASAVFDTASASPGTDQAVTARILLNGGIIWGPARVVPSIDENVTPFGTMVYVGNVPAGTNTLDLQVQMNLSANQSCAERNVSFIQAKR